jgi:hypothetical protein
VALSAYCSSPGSLSLYHIFSDIQTDTEQLLCLFHLTFPKSQKLGCFVSLEMRQAEEQNRLNSLQEEVALWPREAELAADGSATALLQTSKDQYIVKLFTCKTPVYSCNIYYLWTFLPLYGRRFEISFTGGKKCVFMLSLTFMS